MQINRLEKNLSRSTSSENYKKFTGHERMKLDDVFYDNNGKVNAEQECSMSKLK